MSALGAVGRQVASTALRISDLPVLEAGLRPFFLLAAGWAMIAMVLWLAMLCGVLSVGRAYDPVLWHGHEMVYGFASAVLAGFLLTAVPGWTGRPGLSGIGLALFAILWLAGRAAMALAGPDQIRMAAAVDLSFCGLLFVLILRQVVAARNWRNLPVCAAPGVLFCGNLLVHLEALGLQDSGAWGNRLGIVVLVLLIALIGGRIVPAFTQNWLRRRHARPLPPLNPVVDHGVVLATLLTLVIWLTAPGSVLLGVLAAGTALVHAIRLVNWQGWRTAGEPLLLVLHFAYGWLPLSFGLMAMSSFWPALPDDVVLHGFTAGAITGMMLAMMTRAALGHTNRPLSAGGATVMIYVLAAGGAFFRIVASISDGLFLPLSAAAGLCWISAFALYMVSYGLKLCRPKLAIA